MIRQPLSLYAALTLALVLAAGSVESAGWSRPNIVVVLVDDAGLMDFGSYGGEARTPTIDALAADGVRFSNYHTSPLCAPSRAMLLTGLDNHLTGVATIPEMLLPNQADQPGYAMRLAPGVETVATRLQRAGYRTFMTGKWHLGSGPGDLPADHGFDRSFALDASGADNWEQKSYMPYYDHAPWFEDRAPATLPEDFYSSEFLVDRMIHYLEASDAGSDAAFLRLSGVPGHSHIPIQAPREFTDRYDGVYDAGLGCASEPSAGRKRSALGLIPCECAARRHACTRCRDWNRRSIRNPSGHSTAGAWR